MNLKQQYKIHRRSWLGYFYGHILSFLLPKVLRGILIQSYTFWIYIESWNLFTVTFFLKKYNLIQIQALLDLVVTDNPDAIDGRFGLTYSFWSYNRGLRLFLKTCLNIAMPIHSINNIFASAGWLEREAWDMFGIPFFNHGDLRRILTDYGFRGHPLRKDFPLMGFLEIRYEDNWRCLIFEPIELTQEFRLFNFETPWSLWPAN